MKLFYSFLFIIFTLSSFGQWTEISTGYGYHPSSKRMCGNGSGYFAANSMVNNPPHTTWSSSLLFTYDDWGTFFPVYQWNAPSSVPGSSEGYLDYPFFKNDNEGVVFRYFNTWGGMSKTFDGGQSWYPGGVVAIWKPVYYNFLPANINIVVNSARIIVDDFYDTTTTGHIVNTHLWGGVVDDFGKLGVKNDSTYFLLTQDSLLNTNINITEDYGYTWTIDTIVLNRKVNVIDYVNDSLGFIFTDSAECFQTLDAGASWSAYNLPGYPTIKSVAFYSDTKWMLGGMNGEILWTQDGGQNWHIEFIQSSANFIREIQFIDPYIIYAYDSEGSIFRRNNYLGSDQINLTGSLTLYPNPTDGIVKFNLDLETEIDKIQVFDFLGRQLIECSGKEGQIDISHLNSGRYLVRFETRLGPIIKQIVKR